MSYLMLEDLVCVIAVAGIATLVFAISLVMMLAHEGITNAFRVKPSAPSRTTRPHFNLRRP